MKIGPRPRFGNHHNSWFMESKNTVTQIFFDSTLDMLAMPWFDGGIINMRDLLRRLAEQVM